MLVEELDRELVRPDGTCRELPDLGQVEEELADLLFGNLIGRAVEMLGQDPDAMDVDPLCACRQPTKLHVFQHPAS
jgi:hypothetical protein